MSNTDSLEARLQEALEKCERLHSENARLRNVLKTFSFHALRVSYVSSLVVKTGADLKAARTLARHTTPELTMNAYARVRGSKLTEVAEAVGRIIHVIAKVSRSRQESSKTSYASLPAPEACPGHLE